MELIEVNQAGLCGFRACLKRSWPSSEESGDGGDGDQRLGDAGELFVVANETAAFHDPSERALDDPAPAEDDEAFHPGHAPDDLESDVGLVLRPGDQLASVAAVSEDALHEGKAPPGPLQNAFRPVAVLDVGAVDLDREQAAVGVGQDMPFAAMDAFSGVVAFGSPF
jgi:hypothetical protein